ncbi:GNAT family N-acetyltransferase [Aestuariirhabdus litorea]|uniref:GNAT family N-acetyltransferase n=1 Tax=Aestuariirhabdus litorea TaxID=2528527 RepID=A0A3P3VKU2_9GAMM|nr:GNAT family N-acetyltransferase [Aestuariirhabdus litorea]RRJ82927.1 GNAT family N-acetyltransferase [Aestuariirhabdus litorea]RWW93086.1 GNAT family N-acetyltransferase [Endozoicomonadaceae bacterium GTF-13]
MAGEGVDWQWSPWTGLERESLYAILRLRQAVFVVEQNCPYQDADGLDATAWHLGGWRGEGDARELVAYLRVVFPGVNYEEPSVGRVVTAASVRGQGVGRALTAEGVARVEAQYPGAAIRISAQLYLKGFYRGFGFEVVGEPYEEDGIPHIEMLRPGR